MNWNIYSRNRIGYQELRWVCLRNDLESGEQVAELIKVTLPLLTIKEIEKEK